MSNKRTRVISTKSSDEMASVTPYNSIYEKLRGSSEPGIVKSDTPLVDEENVCCVHGTACALGKSDKDEQYITLGGNPPDLLMTTLAQRLGKLATEVPPNSKKNPEVQSVQSLEQAKENNSSKSSKKPRDKSAGRRKPKNADGGIQFEPRTQTPPKKAITNIESAPLGDALAIYLGVKNYADAESSVERRSDFRLYHQLSSRAQLDDLNEQLQLMLVYKTANGSYRHYPVRTDLDGDDVHYYVDYGNHEVRKHTSLNQLVKYYQIYVYYHPKYSTYADPFPWWLS